MIAGRRWLLGLSAVVGAVLAHTVVYALVHPDPGARAHHLAGSGHGYWPAALAVAGLAALVAVVAVVAGAVAPGRRGHLGPMGFGGRLVRLTISQVALFTGMELLEGVVTGSASPALVTHPEFLFGLLLQVVVAATILVVLSVLQRATERLAGLPWPFGVHSPRAVYGSPSHRSGPRTTLGGAARPRGPPRVALI